MNLKRRYDRVRIVLGDLMRSDGLRAKAARGGVWLSGGSVGEQAIRFARNMLLTRLLAPNVFGVMAIVMSASAIVGSLTEVGLRAAVIQNPRGGEKAYLNAGWWMAMIRAFGTYIIIFALAPWVAHFYGNAELSGLLRVALLGTLFEGAMSPRSIIPQKDMKFGRWMAISNGGGILGVVLTIILSLYLRNVWALAIGACSENLFRCILSYVLCPGLPSLGWDRHVVRDLYKYSKGVFGQSFLNLLFSRTDIFVLGKLYSATALGLYTMAVYLVQTPASFLANILVQTLLPTFAHVQDEKERINRIFLEVSSWLTLLGLPGVVALCLCGPPVLSLVYGARYAAAAGPLAVAAAVVFLSTLNAVITIVFSGIGFPALHRRSVGACAAVMIIGIYPACHFLGIVGGQVAALLAIVVGYIYQIIRMRGITQLELVRYARIFVLPAIGSATMLAFVLGIRSLGLATRPLANIALNTGSCVVVYVLCAAVHLRAAKRGDSGYGTRASESVAVL
jgi:lipopolysaccharide exporter